MKDVATAVGVHQTTVSRALRNDNSISPAKRQQIQETAERMGYRTNPLLSALGTLRRQRAGQLYETPIAYLVHSSRATQHSEGARLAAAQRGFRLDIFSFGNEIKIERLNDILKSRNILGVIIGPLEQAHGHFELDWDHFSTVVIEYSFNNPRFDRVVTESYDTMRVAVAQCLARGYRRIGLTLSKIVDDRNEGLLSAAYGLDANRHTQMANIPELIVDEWDQSTFSDWMEMHRPEVIITSNTQMIEITDWLQQHRYRIPQDIGLINLNVAENGHHSGVCQNAPLIGATAATLLVEKLNHNERGIPTCRRTVLTEGIWHEGQTLRSPRKQQKKKALPLN
jgi:LacI family transcriptional regulator/LacI family fructose operon transcriptional repressor